MNCKKPDDSRSQHLRASHALFLDELTTTAEVNQNQGDLDGNRVRIDAFARRALLYHQQFGLNSFGRRPEVAATTAVRDARRIGQRVMSYELTRGMVPILQDLQSSNSQYLAEAKAIGLFDLPVYPGARNRCLVGDAAKIAHFVEFLLWRARNYLYQLMPPEALRSMATLNAERTAIVRFHAEGAAENELGLPPDDPMRSDPFGHRERGDGRLARYVDISYSFLANDSPSHTRSNSSLALKMDDSLQANGVGQAEFYAFAGQFAGYAFRQSKRTFDDFLAVGTRSLATVSAIAAIHDEKGEDLFINQVQPLFGLSERSGDLPDLVPVRQPLINLLRSIGPDQRGRCPSNEVVVGATVPQHEAIQEFLDVVDIASRGQTPQYLRQRPQDLLDYCVEVGADPSLFAEALGVRSSDVCSGLGLSAIDCLVKDGLITLEGPLQNVKIVTDAEYRQYPAPVPDLEPSMGWFHGRDLFESAYSKGL